MQLAPEEPEAGPWRAELLSTVVEAITRREPGNAAPSRPVVLAVDGRSNAGKTTLAARICRTVPGSAVVHTDDFAWKNRTSHRPSGTFASGWPRRHPSTSYSEPGSAPTSLSAAPRRSRTTPSPRSFSRPADSRRLTSARYLAMGVQLRTGAATSRRPGSRESARPARTG